MTPPSAIDIVRAFHAHRRLDAASSIAFDVGAHVGQFSRALIDSGLFAQVVAFEPNPRNLAALGPAAARDPRLVVVPAAVSEAAGQRDFHSDGDDATGSLLAYHPGYATAGRVVTTRVNVTTLDEYRARCAPGQRVSFLKTNTQGHDLAVLRGAAGVLSSDRPLVLTEMIYLPLYAGQDPPDQIAALMTGSGYELHSLLNIHATIEGRLAFADALFTPLECAVPVSQRYVQLDNHASYVAQIAELERICRERLDVINVLDAEVKRLSPAVQR
jgi:FkbM family methyltransferase